jgi:hypothetical protein
MNDYEVSRQKINNFIDMLNYLPEDLLKPISDYNKSKGSKCIVIYNDKNVYMKV